MWNHTVGMMDPVREHFRKNVRDEVSESDLLRPKAIIDYDYERKLAFAGFTIILKNIMKILFFFFIEIVNYFFFIVFANHRF